MTEKPTDEELWVCGGKLPTPPAESKDGGDLPGHLVHLSGISCEHLLLRAFVRRVFAYDKNSPAAEHHEKKAREYEEAARYVR